MATVLLPVTAVLVMLLAICFDLCWNILRDIKHVSITKIVSILSEQMTHPSAIIYLIWHGVTLFFLRLL